MNRNVRFRPIADIRNLDHHLAMAWLSHQKTLRLVSPPANRNAVIEHFADALSERFDRVECKANEVEAHASFKALFYRGRRTHPLLPFNRVTIRIADKTSSSVDAEFHLAFMAKLSLFFVAGVAFQGTAADGIRTGLSMGLGLGGLAFLMNFIISDRRSSSWLRETFARLNTE